MGSTVSIVTLWDSFRVEEEQPTPVSISPEYESTTKLPLKLRNTLRSMIREIEVTPQLILKDLYIRQ
jgi:hypothetical protein